MVSHFENLALSRDLIIAWTGRNIRGRYQQSLLGWLWAIVQPVAAAIIFSVIFTMIVPVDTGDIPYVVFSYVAMVPWTFLSTSLTDMTASLVINMNLLKKIYFPREVIPIAAMLARFMDFMVASTLIIVLMVIYQMPFYLPGLLMLPVILVIQIILIIGIGLLTSAVNIFYRDVQSILMLIIQLWFYASPTIYPITMVPERLQIYYFLNPMAGILEAYRAVLLHATMPGPYLITSAIMAIVVFIIGYVFFKRVEFVFADIV